MSVAPCKRSNGFSKIGSTIDRRFAEALAPRFISLAPLTLKLHSFNRNPVAVSDCLAQFSEASKAGAAKYNLSYRARFCSRSMLRCRRRPHAAIKPSTLNNRQTERNHTYANNHSLGTTQGNGRIRKPSLQSLHPLRPSSSPHQRTWAGRHHSGRLDAAGGHYRRRKGISHQGRVARTQKR